MTNPSCREFDVVLWGATGFTGQCIACMFVRQFGWPGTVVKYALAGRSKERLEVVAGLMLNHWLKHEPPPQSNDRKIESVAATTVVKEDCATRSSVPIIVVEDYENDKALESLASKTLVLLTAAGPYQQIGEPILRACIASGTDYLDLTGEYPWVLEMREKYHSLAVEKKVRCIPCCGLDYLLSELGLVHLDWVKDRIETEARKRTAAANEKKATEQEDVVIKGSGLDSTPSKVAELDRAQRNSAGYSSAPESLSYRKITQIVSLQGVAVSGGTLRSALDLMSRLPFSHLLRLVLRPKSAPYEMCEHKPKDSLCSALSFWTNDDGRDVLIPQYHEESQLWLRPNLASFAMARFTRWSNEVQNHRWGPQLLYCVAGSSSSWLVAWLYTLMTAFLGLAMLLVSKLFDRSTINRMAGNGVSAPSFASSWLAGQGRVSCLTYAEFDDKSHNPSPPGTESTLAKRSCQTIANILRRCKATFWRLLLGYASPTLPSNQSWRVVSEVSFTGGGPYGFTSVVSVLAAYYLLEIRRKIKESEEEKEKVSAESPTVAPYGVLPPSSVFGVDYLTILQRAVKFEAMVTETLLRDALGVAAQSWPHERTHKLPPPDQATAIGTQSSSDFIRRA